MGAPGPAALGRGVVVSAGQAPPGPWRDAPVIAVDDDALASPAGVVAALHEAWSQRYPAVIALGVDPARFRPPPQIEVEVWTLDAGFEVWDDRLQFLVWANTYDARSGEAVWWWARKAARLGAVERGPRDGPGDVTLPDGKGRGSTAAPAPLSPPISSTTPPWCTASRWSGDGSSWRRDRSNPAAPSPPTRPAQSPTAPAPPA